MHALHLIAASLLISGNTVVLATTEGQLDIGESNLLESHNLIRSRFDARPLSWSITLANKAQVWASNCRFEHSNGLLGSVGENIAAGTGNFTAKNAMQMFMDGLRVFDPADPTFSDFTQIIWQSTTELGCASAQCDGIFDATFGEATMYVCLYEPPGNVVGVLGENIGIL